MNKMVRLELELVQEAILLLRDSSEATYSRPDLADLLEAKIAKLVEWSTCRVCGKQFMQTGKGRKRLTCSDLCRQRKYRRVTNPRQPVRKWSEKEEKGLVELVEKYRGHWSVIAALLGREEKSVKNKVDHLRRLGKVS